MEPLYEYFYEIQGYSLTMIIIYWYAKPYIAYRLNKRRNTQRDAFQSPFRLRLKAKLNNTALGKFNLKTHLLWENIRNKYADKMIFYSKFKLNWYFLRTGCFALYVGAFLGIIFGEFTKGFRIGYVLHANDLNYNYHGDKVLMYLESAKDPKYVNHILDWDLKNKIHAEKFDVLDCIQYGKLMGSVLQDEIAFQCYYLAHLKDHQNIKTNAGLELDTFITSTEKLIK